MKTVMRMRMFLLLFSLALLPVSTAAQDNKEVLEQARKLFQSEPIPCADKKGCYCVQFSPKANIPLRYTKAQLCPQKIKAGRVVVLFKSWDVNGHRVDEGRYVNGKAVGLWTSWHPNGIKAAECNFKNGKQNGPFTVWHDNGRVEVQGRYIDDKGHGEWRYWDRTGKLTRKIIWKNGRLLSKREFK